jgi:hypothetical protein
MLIGEPEIVNGLSNKATRFGGGGLVRKFNKDSTWTKLRIGIRMAFYWNTPMVSAIDMYGSPYPAVGLCNDPVSVTRLGSTNHFVGVRNTSATMNDFAGPYWFWTLQGAKQVGSTHSVSAEASVATFVNSLALSKRAALYVDITKGSPYTITAFYQANSSAVDFTDANWNATFLTESLAAPTLTDYDQDSWTMAVDEGTDGVLDHVCLYWQPLNPMMQIDRLQLHIFS